MSMTPQNKAAEMMRKSGSLDYWNSVEKHPLGEVIPGLVAITAAQWKFWSRRPLIIQADLAMGGNAIEVAKDETKEKLAEMEKLYRGDTTPLMVAMEAADEIVFLDIFVGMHPNDMTIWDSVKDEALGLAHGALETISQMQVLAGKRRERDVANLLGDVPTFVSSVVISDKNVANYSLAYFVPVPPIFANDKQKIVSVYDKARHEARRVRNEIKRQGLYTAFGMPNHLTIFERLNGRTPDEFKHDPVITIQQSSLREHFLFYVDTFGDIGLKFLINYFRLNDPAMIQVVEESRNR